MIQQQQQNQHQRSGQSEGVDNLCEQDDPLAHVRSMVRSVKTWDEKRQKKGLRLLLELDEEEGKEGS